MIATTNELTATVEYVVKLADTLEGLRLYAQETGETALLPLNAAGPLAHLRENLAEIRAYVERFTSSDSTVFAMTASNTLGIGVVSAESERTLVETQG
jgi:predicted ATPase